MAPAGMLASVSSMPLQQTLVDRSFCAQSRQTGPASSKDDSKQRKSSRQYTPREVAAIAAAWVEYKPYVLADTEIAAQVAAAFIKDAAPEQKDPDDKEVLAQLQHKKRKTSGQPSVAEVFLSKEKQVLLTMALYDFFLENSDCVAMHACEHPSLQRFCSLAGIKPLNRKFALQRLAGPVLDKQYAETVGSVDQVLNVNGVHALAVSTI
ncbi:TPA: hypothetical protein ACH3X1_005030 [Trebouxia sp. C0004]